MRFSDYFSLFCTTKKITDGRNERSVFGRRKRRKRSRRMRMRMRRMRIRRKRETSHPRIAHGQRYPMPRLE